MRQLCALIASVLLLTLVSSASVEKINELDSKDDNLIDIRLNEIIKRNSEFVKEQNEKLKKQIDKLKEERESKKELKEQIKIESEFLKEQNIELIQRFNKLQKDKDEKTEKIEGELALGKEQNKKFEKQLEEVKKEKDIETKKLASVIRAVDKSDDLNDLKNHIKYQIINHFDNSSETFDDSDVPFRTVTREDYEHTPGIGSHKFYTESKSWVKARRACREDGAHLAIINSEAEELLLARMLRENKRKITYSYDTDHALIGISDRFEEGKWMTVLGEPLEKIGYVHWRKGEPNSYHGREENCGALRVTNEVGMNDVPCTYEFAYICELYSVHE